MEMCIILPHPTPPLLRGLGGKLPGPCVSERQGAPGPTEVLPKSVQGLEVEGRVGNLPPDFGSRPCPRVPGWALLRLCTPEGATSFVMSYSSAPEVSIEFKPKVTTLHRVLGMGFWAGGDHKPCPSNTAPPHSDAAPGREGAWLVWGLCSRQPQPLSGHPMAQPVRSGGWRGWFSCAHQHPVSQWFLPGQGQAAWGDSRCRAPPVTALCPLTLPVPTTAHAAPHAAAEAYPTAGPKLPAAGSSVVADGPWPERNIPEQLWLLAFLSGPHHSVCPGAPTSPDGAENDFRQTCCSEQTSRAPRLLAAGHHVPPTGPQQPQSPTPGTD